MANMVRDARLETRSAREKLKVRDREYWKMLVPGQLHLGYRKRRENTPGTWTIRRYLGGTGDTTSPYVKKMLDGRADDYQDADGIDVVSYAQAQEMAFAMARIVREERRRPPTVAEAMEEYFESIRHKSSVGDAQSRSRVHIVPTLGSTKVEDLTLRQLTKWANDLAEQPARKRTRPGAEQQYRAAPSGDGEIRARRATANRTITVLKAALNLLYKTQRVKDDHAWRLLKPFGETDAARPGHLDAAQAARLIDKADAASGFRDLVHAALLSGCRYGELCALKVGSLVRGRGGWMLHIAKSKSGKKRDVVLVDDAAAFFADICRDRDPGETMLLRQDGQPWGPSHQARPMAKACRDAKVPTMGFHQLRHTWASLAVMNGMPMLIVAKNLGHSDTRMVEKHYGHLGDDYVARMLRETAPRYSVTPGSNVVRLADRAAS